VKQFVELSLIESQEGLLALLNNAPMLERIARAGEHIASVLHAGNRAFSCGNGGSMCDAMHFAEECSGRFRENRDALPALAISDASHISCTANDFGWEKVFSRYIAAHGRAGDVLIAISTSGKSPNILEAACEAKSRGMKIISLTGKPESELGQLADFDICTPAGKFSDRIQELHIKVLHIFVEIVERKLFPHLYEFQKK
jgi:D-sedoheptulose 7-phosphate isomerase